MKAMKITNVMDGMPFANTYSGRHGNQLGDKPRKLVRSVDSRFYSAIPKSFKEKACPTCGHQHELGKGDAA